MPKRFRSRGCMVVTLLTGVVTLLSCSALFLLAVPPPAPDALAELKQLTPYPGAQKVSYSQPGNQNIAPGTGVWISSSGSGGSAIYTRSNAQMLVYTGDRLETIFDFYVAELTRAGFDCGAFPPAGRSPGAGGSGLMSRLAHCSKIDQSFPQLVFIGFEGPNAAPPWFEIIRPSTFRSAEVNVNRLQNVTELGIDYYARSMR
ncbi:MAG TPA: hypothetical protein VFH60_09310 [Chloroflexia bacterium]|nr:hypothetical protein [Chloroflexia bacterium]